MSAATQLQLAPTTIARPEALETIVSEVVRACERRYPGALRAIVLAGSMARGESTVIFHDDACHVLGDADFLVVFQRRSMLPAQTELIRLEAAIAQTLGNQGIICAVHLAGVSVAYFRRLPAHIFSYELRATGKVVMGDASILASIPQFHTQEIEREDAWRLLSNRITEWLESLAAEIPGRQKPSLDLFYATVKLWIDAATSLLVFLRAYEPGCQARADRLAGLARNQLPLAQLPFPLKSFSAGVEASTAWKLMPDRVGIEQMGWAFCHQVRRMAGALWCWEEAQMSDLNAAWAPLTLLQNSPVDNSRWRGWLRTARECRRLCRARAWRRWWALSHWGSPRHCVYAVAAECLLRHDDFGPWAADDLVSRLRTNRLRKLLPLAGLPRSQDNDGWRLLVRELAWNYHELIEKTRA